MYFRDEDIPYRAPRMTDEQMAALEYLIVQSPDATAIAKKAIIWTLRLSEHLTRAVAVSFSDEEFSEGIARDIQNGAHDMSSCNGTTHIGAMMKAMGTEVGLSHHCGMFVDATASDGVDSEAPGRTIWFSHTWHDRTAFRLKMPRRSTIVELSLKEAVERLYPR